MADAVPSMLAMMDPDMRERTERALAHMKACHECPERAQAFFVAMATEMRRPHFGDMQRGWVQAMLTRAQEAGLYDPKENA